MKKNVFIFFWLPYAAKYTYQTYLTAFYIAVNKIPAEQCIHIGPAALFEPPPPELPADWLRGYDCRLPSSQKLSTLLKRTIDPAIFNDIQQKFLSNNLVWKYLLTQRHAGLENELSRILAEISSEYNVEAVLAWGNTPSLSQVAQNHGLKVIHHEIGPLRSPFYTYTAYFDFSGVNGNTEAALRFANLKHNTGTGQLKTLSFNALLSIFGEERYFSEIFKTILPQFDTGVPLQVEDDSNILAFSNGFNNYEAIAFAKSQSKQVLIRKHPSGHANYLATQDNSGSVIEFIKRVNKIITINSSVGFEAMLYGKSSQILGDAPFAFIANTTGTGPDNSLLTAINFFLFGYLIPFKLIFDTEYYRWRLTEPSELEIYSFHLNYHFESRGLLAPAQLSSNQLEAEALNRSQKYLINLTGIHGDNSNLTDAQTAGQLEGEMNNQPDAAAASLPFVSYAQNFEDVMLWRALKHVEHGFYIDIGAQDPVIDSVSLAFYEHGWRGIHVEPSPNYAEKLRHARPDETLIQAATGSKDRVLRFYEIEDTGLSTGNLQVAETHRAAGFSVREIDVPCLTLANILDRCSDREIHWLKIDVEGMEKQVLRGWLPSTVRPWVVVIESTMPLTQEETHDKWEPLLLELGYDFVYFDGLNRFYLSKAHLELKDAFRSGPNVFDGFTLSGTASAPFCSQLIQRLNGTQEETQRLSHTLAERERALGEMQAAREHESHLQAHAEWLQNEWDAAKAKVDELNHSSHHWWSMADGLNRELQCVYATKSWRVTWPLREANVHFKRSARMIGTRISALTSLPHRVAQRVLRSILKHLQARPEHKDRIARTLARFPSLDTQLRALHRTHNHTQTSCAEHSSPRSITDSNIADRFRRQLELELIRRRQNH